jgi:polar amino acid transport system substrate-binding protein
MRESCAPGTSRRRVSLTRVTGKRRIFLAAAALLLAVLAFAAAGCGSSKKSSEGTTTASSSCSKADLNLVTPATLTVGTDNPAYPPWFGGTPHKPWQVSDPNSGEGYESAVAYAVAKQLGFAKDEVKWIHVPFNTSFAPGPKKFDFDINQISFTPARAKQVSFSDSYYDVNQSVVVNKGTPIASVKSVAGLKPYSLGAQLGTTSYQFIKDTIKPSKQPSVFPTNAGAVQALKNKQIDGLVLDLPTAFYVTAVQVPNSTVLGQFEAEPGGEHFGMVFTKGNSLVHCVNGALTKLRDDGTLQQLHQKWLAKATGAPTLK